MHPQEPENAIVYKDSNRTIVREENRKAKARAETAEAVKEVRSSVERRSKLSRCR
jgi:hypothetical protein